MQNLGSSYEPFAIKVPFATANPLQTEELKKKVVHACESVCQLIYRAQLFVNFYILSHQQDTLHCVFTDNFWYSITQLVNGRKVTNPNVLPLDLMKSWKAFCDMYPSVVRPDYLHPGEAQSISYACTKIATAYQKAIVDLFQQKRLPTPKSLHPPHLDWAKERLQ